MTKLDKIKNAEAIDVYNVITDSLPEDCSEKIFITTKLNKVPKALKTYFENIKYFLRYNGMKNYDVEDLGRLSKIYPNLKKETIGDLYYRIHYGKGKVENRWVDKVTLTGEHVKAYMNIVNMDKVVIC